MLTQSISHKKTWEISALHSWLLGEWNCVLSKTHEWKKKKRSLMYCLNAFQSPPKTCHSRVSVWHNEWQQELWAANCCSCWGPEGGLLATVSIPPPDEWQKGACHFLVSFSPRKPKCYISKVRKILVWLVHIDAVDLTPCGFWDISGILWLRAHTWMIVVLSLHRDIRDIWDIFNPESSDLFSLFVDGCWD